MQMRTVAVFLLGLCSFGTAQRKEAAPSVETARRAVEAWSSAETPSEESLRAAARTVLRAGPAALADLAERLRAQQRRAAGADPVVARRLRRLLEELAVESLRAARASEMVYAGQFAHLGVLQPYIGDAFTRLLLDTPPWFPETDRVLLVRPLMDLYPQAPDEDALEQIRRIADDAQVESRALREAVALLLAQWGDREPLERRLSELRRRIEESRGDDRLAAEREVARVLHDLRDYPAAAAAYARMLRRAEKEGLRILPADYYNAACAMSMAGDLESALAELERCVELMTAEETDPALRLEAGLFEKDPELRAVRPTRRFARLFQRAFPGRGQDGGRKK